jgi:preprotein translocase subunit SecF
MDTTTDSTTGEKLHEVKAPYNFDFVKYRKVAVFGSLAVNLGILLGLAAMGLNMGVDFAGGSEINVKFANNISAGDVRKSVETAGFKEPVVQEYGAAGEHAFLIRIGKVALLTPEQAKGVEEAVKAAVGGNLVSFRYDPDQGDKFEVATKGESPEAQVKKAFEAKGVGVLGFTKVGGDSNSQTGAITYEITTRGIADKLDRAFRELDKLGPDAPTPRQSIDYVGPQVGRELRNRGIMAVLYAMGAILLYTFLRFDFRFAPGGVVALVHDVIVVLGYYVFTRREFNLISVTVLLTIVGYSINDTIVVYDRIRENLGRHPGMNFPALINLSINETLTRTILTSGVTAISLLGLLVFSVGSIWDFAAAMMVGIVTGPYSSIYIASPVTIWLEEQMGKHDHLTTGTPTTPAAQP